MSTTTAPAPCWHAQHEFDTEPTFIVPDGDMSQDQHAGACITLGTGLDAKTRRELADLITGFLNSNAHGAAGGPSFIFIQEGGSTGEFYISACGSAEEAEESRIETAEASYRTSPVIEVPESLALHPSFYETAEALLRASTDLEYATA